MSFAFLQRLFGSRNTRLLKSYQKTLQQINELESDLTQYSDEALKAQTSKFREMLANGVHLQKILPEVFATVREVAKRVLNMRHFDVQIIGGIALINGKIAEMHTGEGKTLVATLPAVLYALTGKGVHIITVNDYLATRDAEWMGPIYEFLGLSVGVVTSTLKKLSRKEAYQADITYGTNNEFGFDYLRDNMAFSLDEKVQRELHFALVDEVDSILIDEARTPLIISGAVQDNIALYTKINDLIPKLKRQKEEKGAGDFFVDEKARQVFLSEVGQEKVEQLFKEAELLEEGDNLYSAKNANLLHHLNAALKAHILFMRDVDYIVRNNEVVIVDEHTGRTMPGRRWSEGIHQAVEAKENVKIQSENQTLASITFQNYFRLYDTLAGMTGTADTEAYEFQHIYGLEVVVIPTNKPNQRKDTPDLVYLTQREKFQAVIKDIKQSTEKGQPVLVGTASIEASEILSKLLQAEKIPHQVLNAKFHEKEAEIIAEAGRRSAITIATNMAGRGTDIVLGGNLERDLAALKDPTEAEKEAVRNTWKKHHKEVLQAGGLRVIGSERHESRRIDNQLRGRSARQGDPGESCFYLSLEDNLMRIFAPPSLKGFMQKLGMSEGEAIRSKLVTRAIENAQRKVESHNFDIRKQLLQYDDVANEQRKFIYTWRNELMHSDSLSETLQELLQDAVEGICLPFIPPESLEEQWNIPELCKELKNHFNLDYDIPKWLEEDEALNESSLRSKILSSVQEAYQKQMSQSPPEIIHNLERAILLHSLDTHWKEHLAAMDHLREGIHLRGYAQKDPKQEYKREAFNLFSSMLDAIKLETISTLLSFEIQTEEELSAIEAQRKQATPEGLAYHHDQLTSLDPELFAPVGGAEAALPTDPTQTPFVRQEKKIGRNDPCHCGSGKKFKLCHGQMGNARFLSDPKEDHA